MNPKKSPYIILVSALLLWAFNTGPAHSESSIEAFYGVYKGQATSESNTPRKLLLSIKPLKEKGFEVDWSTTTFTSGSGKTKSYSVSFVPSGREHIFSSAMRRNLFGKLIPMDPLKGDPFVWCKIEGNSLIVYSLLIDNDGGYEMQEYDRTLSGDKMSLRFSRIRNGTPLKVITGEYARVK